MSTVEKAATFVFVVSMLALALLMAWVRWSERER